VTESFTPDFYLPQFDLFIELTTESQDPKAAGAVSYGEPEGLLRAGLSQAA
jgi:hypothetical protein